MTDPVDVSLQHHGRTYYLYVDGRLYDSFAIRHGPLLTLSQMIDVQEGYRDGLTGLVD